MSREHIDESHRLRRVNDILRKALEQCADDLECEINNHYSGTLDYPSQKAKFDRDMQTVVRARAALKE